MDNGYTIAKKVPRAAYKRELKSFYKTMYTTSMNRLRDGHFLFDTEINYYLQELKQTIADANTEYNFDETFLLVSRYTWPNAFSVGDGSIVVNLGLVEQLQNESQLAFVLCHEFSHYFLNHADKRFIERFNDRHSAAFKQKLEKINSSEYYKNTRLKKLLKDNIYSERSHNRALEYQADSLGLAMYLNAGFDLDEVIGTLLILDDLNNPKEERLPLFDIFNVDTVAYPPSSIGIKDEYHYDVLDDDRIKTHPDCLKRIDVIKELNPSSIVRRPINTTQFDQFKDMLHEEAIFSMFFFNNVDDALISCLQKYMDGDSSAKNNTAIIVSLHQLIKARKEHRVNQYLDRPNDCEQDNYYNLSCMVYMLRMKILTQRFYAMANNLYPSAIKNEITAYRMVELAYFAKDLDLFEERKHQFLEEYPNSIHYQEVTYLTLD